jgi:competence protein ComEC
MSRLSSTNNPFSKIANSKSRTFLSFCFCFIFGIGFFSVYEIKSAQFILYVSALCIAILCVFFWKNIQSRFFLLCFLFFLLGGLRFFYSVPSDSASVINFYHGRRTTFTGHVSEEPRFELDQTQYIVETEEMQTGEKVSGRVKIVDSFYSEFSTGDKLQITCSLEKPSDFQIKNLKYKNVWTLCRKPIIDKIGESKSFLSVVYKFKMAVSENVSNLWQEPQSSLMAGLLYGARAGLPKDVVEDFSRSGITHIIAVSGYNISIIATALLNVLIYIGLRRGKAFYIAVVLIALFVVFTGASASVVRAGIMGIIVLLASYLGRMSRVGNTLAFAAAVMMLLNPFVLVWDVGFQLSFLSTIGLVYFSPILEKYFINKMSERKFLFFKSAIIPTISAIIFTTPLVLCQSGRFSVIAPIANILILWIIPYVMFFGFLALVLSFLFFPISYIPAFMSDVGLRYILMISDFLSSFSFSSISVSVTFPVMITMYVLILYFVFRKYGKNKNC